MSDTRTPHWVNQLKEKGFFRYVGRNLLVIILAYVLIVLIGFLVEKYLIDFKQLFQGVIDHLSDRLVLILFFVSESFLGMIPVDLFVIWTQKFEHPIAFQVLLGILSYSGGIISYGIGKWISQRERICAYTERRLAKYVEFVRKWGGAFIIIAALFPFTPFSLVVIAITLFHYPFRLFLLFALARLVRFILLGLFYFDLLNVDSWMM